VQLCLPVGVRRNFSEGKNDILLVSFRLLTMQRKLMHAKRFTLSAP